MRVVGVIAEYNPFHLGHAHHLAEARRLAKADAVVVVMSSVFTQRGEAAICSPAERARMALSAGAAASVCCFRRMFFSDAYSPAGEAERTSCPQ